MRPAFRLICALAFALPAIQAYGDLPTKDDPLPFAEIDCRDVPSKDSSSSASATRPYGPFATVGTVDNLGDPKQIEFRGVEEISVDDIRSALRWDPKFQAAARPSNSAADFLAVLESRVLDGFQSSGFPDAKVAVSLDTATKRVVVAVTEGPRFRQGQIVVTGDDRVDAQQVADRLTHEQKPRPWKIRYAWCTPPTPPPEGSTLWQAGENLNSTTVVRNNLKSGVRLALVEQGFPYASFDLDCVPAAEPGLSDLHLEIKRLGPKATIDDIQIHGLKRDSREQVLDYLGITAGQQLSGALLDEINRKLTNSCRYWSHRLVVHCGPAPDAPYPTTDQSTAVKIKLDVEEYSHVPPLHERLSAVDEALRKAARWINEFPQEGSRDVIVERANDKGPSARDRFSILPSAIAANGSLALNIRCNSRSNWSVDHSLLIGMEGLSLVDWAANVKFDTPLWNAKQLELRIETSHHDDGDYAHRLFFGWATAQKRESTTAASAAWSVRAEPVALVHVAHRQDTKSEINDGILIISSPDSRFEFDVQTGALIRLEMHAEDGSTLTARTKMGGYDAIAQPLHQRAEALPNRYADQRPVSSLFLFALAQIQRQPYVENHDSLRRVVEAAEILQKFSTINRFFALLDQRYLEHQALNAAPERETPKFFISPASTKSGDTITEIIELHFIYYIPGIADRLFPRGSWPWTVTREFAFAFLGDGTADEPLAYWNRMVRELARLERSKQLGPVAAGCCLYAIGFWPDERELELLGRRVAECGLRQSTDHGLAQDIELFAAGDSGWAKMLQNLVDDFASLPAEERQELLALLPKPWADTLTEIQQRRADKPDEATGETLAHVLQNRWSELAGKAIEKRLRERTATAISIPATAAKPANATQQK